MGGSSGGAPYGGVGNEQGPGPSVVAGTITPPGDASEGAVAPEDLSGMFPGAEFATYDPAKWYKSNIAPYKHLNPIKFAKKYGNFARSEMEKNFQFGQKIGLAELDTELQGLQHFAPAAAALKRNETAIDNLFNQYMRTQQVDSTMPGARAALKDQFGRAQTYASGRLPDSMMDAAMSLNSRSASADMSSAGGFGAGSSVSRKASDLMSAEQRMQVGMMGEQLLGSNLQSTAALELAPTEYSDAGTQIRVMPEVGAGRLAAAAYSEANQLGMIPAQTAMSAQIQQRQYRSSQIQQNRQFNTANKIQVGEFNASNELQNSQFNAGVANQFSLAKFGYQVAQAGAVAGATTSNNQAALGVQQQQAAQQIYSDYMGQAQGANTGSSIMQGITGIVSGVAGSGILDGILGGGGGGGGASAAEQFIGGFFRSAPVSSTSDGAQSAQAADISTPAAVPRAAQFEDAASVPSGYTALAPMSDGSMSAAPTETIAANMSTFSADTGIRLDPTGAQQATVSRALLSAGSVLNSAGVSYASVPGQQAIGMNLAGDQMFGSTALMQSSNAGAGAAVVAGAAQALAPLGVMTPEDEAALGQIGTVAGSERMQSRLDTLSAAQDGGGFVGATLGGLGIGSAASNKEAAYASHQLYQAWDRMSASQKSLALSNLGIQNFKFSDKKGFDTKVVPATEGTPYKPMTVSQAMILVKSGYNAYAMADAWETVNDVHAVKTGRAGNLLEVADTAKSLGMLGHGTKGAAVPGITREKLGSAGWRGVPSLGVGAIKARAGTRVPSGYTTVSSDDKGILAVPKDHVATAIASDIGGLVGTAAGSGGSSLSAKAVYKSWKPAPAGKAIVGGSSVLAGVYNMSPEEQAALSISSMFKNVG